MPMSLLHKYEQHAIRYVHLRQSIQTEMALTQHEIMMLDASFSDGGFDLWFPTEGPVEVPIEQVRCWAPIQNITRQREQRKEEENLERLEEERAKAVAELQAAVKLPDQPDAEEAPLQILCDFGNI